MKKITTVFKKPDGWRAWSWIGKGIQDFRHLIDKNLGKKTKRFVWIILARHQVHRKHNGTFFVGAVCLFFRISAIYFHFQNNKLPSKRRVSLMVAKKTKKRTSFIF